MRRCIALQGLLTAGVKSHTSPHGGRVGQDMVRTVAQCRMEPATTGPLIGFQPRDSFLQSRIVRGQIGFPKTKEGEAGSIAVAGQLGSESTCWLRGIIAE